MIPRIIAERTTASADLALAVLSPRERWEVWDLVQAAMRTLDDAMTCVVDVRNKRVYVTTEGATSAAWIALVDGAKETWIRCAPDDSHFIATWAVVDEVSWTDMTEYFHPVNQRTLVRIVRKFSAPVNKVYPSAFLLIDQNAGQVTAFFTADDNQFMEDLANIAPNGESLAYQLVDTTAQHLVFE